MSNRKQREKNQRTCRDLLRKVSTSVCENCGRSNAAHGHYIPAIAGEPGFWACHNWPKGTP